MTDDDVVCVCVCACVCVRACVRAYVREWGGGGGVEGCFPFVKFPNRNTSI